MHGISALPPDSPASPVLPQSQPQQPQPQTKGSNNNVLPPKPPHLAAQAAAAANSFRQKKPPMPSPPQSSPPSSKFDEVNIANGIHNYLLTSFSIDSRKCTTSEQIIMSANMRHISSHISQNIFLYIKHIQKLE